MFVATNSEQPPWGPAVAVGHGAETSPEIHRYPQKNIEEIYKEICLSWARNLCTSAPMLPAEKLALGGSWLAHEFVSACGRGSGHLDTLLVAD